MGFEKSFAMLFRAFNGAADPFRKLCQLEVEVSLRPKSCRTVVPAAPLPSLAIHTVELVKTRAVA